MERAAYSAFWNLVVTEWLARGDPRLRPGNVGAFHLPLGEAGVIHYEWHLHARTSTLDVALDFETPDDVSENLRRVGIVHGHRNAIERGIRYAFSCGFFGDKSARAKFVIPFDDLSTDGADLAVKAVDVMLELVRRTEPLVAAIAGVCWPLEPPAKGR